MGYANVVCAIAPDSTIITQGYVGALNGPQFMRLDLNGDTLFTRNHGLWWTWTLSGGLHPGTDGNWLLAGQVQANTARCALLRFSPLFDTVQMVQVPSSTLECFTSVDLSADSSIWAFGTSGTSKDLIAVRFNEQLQIQDSLRYITSYQESCRNGIATLDGGFAVSGIRELSATNDDVHIIKADAGGNVQWQRTIGDDWFELGGSIEKAPDSSYYVACGYRWPGVNYARSTLVRLNSAGVPQWYCVLPSTSSSWLLSKPVITSNGTILAAGKSMVNGYYRGQVICADTSGTLLWQQVFATDTTEGNVFLDMQQHPDGGFVLVGQAVDVQTGLESSWVVKTDSMGCLVPGCDALNSLQEQRMDLRDVLQLSPNPANDHVLVTISLPSGSTIKQELTLAVVSGQGSIVMQSRIPSRSEVHRVGLSGLAAGQYYVHLLDGAQWLAGGAFVKQ